MPSRSSLSRDKAHARGEGGLAQSLHSREWDSKHVWWSIGAGVHVEPHSHANEQIVWMLKGKMEFRLGSEQRVCGPGDVVVIPGVAEHEGWFREDTEVIDFFPPPRDDFLLGGKPAYMSEG